MNNETIETIRYWLMDTLSDWADDSFWCAVEDYFGKDVLKQLADDNSPDWMEKVTNYILEYKRTLFLQKCNVTSCNIAEQTDDYPCCLECDPEKKKTCNKYGKQLNYLNKLSFLSLLQHYGNVSEGANNFVDDVIMPILKKHQK